MSRHSSISESARREVADVFGQAALEELLRAGDQTGRVAEGWARRNGGTLDDMRKGQRPESILLVDPIDSPGSSNAGGPRAGTSELDKAANPTSRARRRARDDSVPTEKKKTVTKAGGRGESFTVALTKEDYEAADAILELRAVERDRAVLARREAAAVGSVRKALTVPMAADVPARYRKTQAAIRLYALGMRHTAGRDALRLIDDAQALGAFLTEAERDAEARSELCQLCAGVLPCECAEHDPSLDEDWYGPDAEPTDPRSAWEIDNEVDLRADRLAEAWGKAWDEAHAEDALRALDNALGPWIEWVRAGDGDKLDRKSVADRAWEAALRFNGAGVTSPPNYAYVLPAYQVGDDGDPLCPECLGEPGRRKSDGLGRNCIRRLKTKTKMAARR